MGPLGGGRWGRRLAAVVGLFVFTTGCVSTGHQADNSGRPAQDTSTPASTRPVQHARASSTTRPAQSVKHTAAVFPTHWSSYSIASGGWLGGPHTMSMSCPSTGLCVAATSTDSLYVSTSPLSSAGGWKAISLDPGNEMKTDSCSSTSLCVAADDDDNVFVSADPTVPAPTWTRANLDGDRSTEGVPCSADGVACAVTSLSCAGTTCAASTYDGSILATTNVTAGASSWRLVSLPAGFAPVGVSCGSPTFCLAIDGHGGVAASSDLASNTWAAAKGYTPIETSGAAISCSGNMWCAALDETGDTVWLSKDPIVNGWSTVDLSGMPPQSALGPNPLTAVSCPSGERCVVANLGGGIAISPDPLGRSGWKTTTSTGNSVWALSCPSPSTCIALDSAGNVLVGT